MENHEDGGLLKVLGRKDRDKRIRNDESVTKYKNGMNGPKIGELSKFFILMAG